MVSSPGELNDGDTCSSIGGESSSSNNESTLSSIYSLNEALRLTVTYTEEWLCVARMPLDFTKAEFDKLLSEYGPVSQSFLIHSETSGKWKNLFFQVTVFRTEFWPFFLTFVTFFVVAKVTWTIIHNATSQKIAVVFTNKICILYLHLGYFTNLLLRSEAFLVTYKMVKCKKRVIYVSTLYQFWEVNMSKGELSNKAFFAGVLLFLANF